MCLCKGAGGITERRSWGISFNPCPDTNCQFDREKARKEYDQWSAELHRKIKQMSDEDEYCKEAN